MNFWQRFRFFLVGFIPGCIILVFIINKKGCTSPNELKMQELQFQTMQLGPKALCKIQCLKQTETLFRLNLKKFEVDYSLSEVHKEPYGTYYLKAIDKKDALYEMIVDDKDTITFINDIKLISPAIICNCDSVN
jgi:hypothetical protein